MSDIGYIGYDVRVIPIRLVMSIRFQTNTRYPIPVISLLNYRNDLDSAWEKPLLSRNWIYIELYIDQSLSYRFPILHSLISELALNKIQNLFESKEASSSRTMSVCEFFLYEFPKRFLVRRLFHNSYLLKMLVQKYLLKLFLKLSRFQRHFP